MFSNGCYAPASPVGGPMGEWGKSARGAETREDEHGHVHADPFRRRDPGEDKACVAWTRDLFKALAPHAMGSVYVNFMPADETDRIKGAFGPNYARLAEVKRRYDLQNLFRLNQNIALVK